MPTILIVDDTESSRELLGRFLRKHGCQILSASNGAEALEVMRTGAPRPDLILLDIMMPVMDGIEFLTHLRADTSHAHVPVIVVSASSDPRVIAHANELGARDYLIKSKFSISTLLDRIGQTLSLPLCPSNLAAAGSDEPLSLRSTG